MASHPPEFLVKYCTAETAGKILDSQTLRWSSPHLYGDPFELSHESGLNFDPHILLQAATQAAISMVFAKDAPRGNSPLLNVIRRWRDEERFTSPEEAEDVLRELLSRMVDARQSVIDKVMSDWRQYSRSLRICSFTAKADNLSAWNRFSDNHKGIAIRFQCGEYTELPEPKEVSYGPNRPEVTNLKDQLNCILYSENHNAQDDFLNKFCHKPAVNSSEKEWRLFQNSSDEIGSDQSQWFEDIAFERAQISAIYFGAFTPTADKRAVYAIVKEKYPKAKVFQAKAVSGKYEIEFERIAAKK